MGRPKKSVAASRSNGAKASNKGKVVSAKIPVICPKVQWKNGSAQISFETQLRAKLHKKAKYRDEADSARWVAEARWVVQQVERGNMSAKSDDGMSYDEARGIVASYQAATAAAK